MTGHYLSVGRVERRLWTGNTEAIAFEPGVNLLIGRPNTGKTQWLKIIDFLLGDPDPFESRFDEVLSEKYEAAAAEFLIGSEKLVVERRWREAGMKTKAIVDGEVIDAVEFQHRLMAKLGIPVLHYPKGNPQSGQTWPELSFRSLLRHIHRRQGFWSDLADKQPEGEQHACLLQFGGIAELIYSDEYGDLIELTLEARRLTARLEQYNWTLDALARDLLDENDPIRAGVTKAAIEAGDKEVTNQILELRAKRIAVIDEASQGVASAQSSRVAHLSAERARLLVERETSERHGRETADRLADMLRYRADLTEELTRLARAHDAGELLADLRITHCPACDQVLKARERSADHCHLCHQHLPDEPEMSELGDARLLFEQERLQGEVKEASDLVGLLNRDLEIQRKGWTRRKEELRQIENELEPARAAVSALIQENVSGIDVELGRLSERQRQITRLKTALKSGEDLKAQVDAIQKRIEPLQEIVDTILQSVDFQAPADWLAEGMNAYLTRIEQLKPGAWSHSPVNITFNRRSFEFRVGKRRWSAALGGSDTLYFLMAYHYGLLSLSDKPGMHYPGISVIDLPGDFLGESVEDKENFIVKPFIELLSRESFEGAQVIITGAAFDGLTSVRRQTLHEVFKGQ
ncbi:conserved hypothetical protein [Bosea sp. 62]|uniref:hypothetical protein n=1 Tax=unclassified Bosea (in: a-proteobacteria) TaxID=2653178 RepID=UPI00125172F5|nr:MULTISPECIES: hypothetical protein [unclassified Bosea (in: a-proteobacteria)]CAD5261017.1 conserved hypothetical protein [Bosea sp. 7B]CAD5271546.1 conserved hypothetical protein [Bosea sp. 21B]CAD5273721.1 conserved hypothetical protein [Bosea sp. 46]VVT56191.1 conserved hypothetical protein [Bosea sp. EC-HK365B]VXB63549.1 conserved hypothetical protein [Bosea sp. 62]